MEQGETILAALAVRCLPEKIPALRCQPRAIYWLCVTRLIGARRCGPRSSPAVTLTTNRRFV